MVTDRDKIVAGWYERKTVPVPHQGKTHKSIF